MSFVLKLGGGGGSEKTIVTSSGQVVGTRASLIFPPVIPSSTVGKYVPLSTRPVSLPFPVPKPTFTGGQSLFGGRFSLPQPSGVVQPYRPVTSPFAFGGVSLPSIVPKAVAPAQAITPVAQPSVPVVTQETVKTQASGSSSNVGLWQGGLLLGPLVLGWLFGTKTIKHRRHRGLRHRLRRLRRPSFRRVRHRRHRR